MLERPRRLRRTPQMRGLVRETELRAGALMAPLFVVPGSQRREAIPSLPGQARLSPDLALAEARRLAGLGVGGVLLFGVPDAKDEIGYGAAAPDGPVPRALTLMKEHEVPLVLAADVCLCEYTTHGHCGILAGTEVDNDRTLKALGDIAFAYARAGADVVAPSAMMDGQVAAIRARLDAAAMSRVAIMAYASKHASVFYAPFRDAAGSAPGFGDRKSYQMDPANRREALREMRLDAEEGADFLMVKPAITSLDLLSRARNHFQVPLVAYQVSGELAMLEAASERGWLERRPAALELLTAIRRAGADVIITYLAAEVASWLAEEST